MSLRRELKEKFLSEFTPAEQVFFLRKAREAIQEKGYPSKEDLFHYCFFLTLRERIRVLHSGAEGYARVLFVEGMREVEDAVKIHEERLERAKGAKADPEGADFLASLATS